MSTAKPLQQERRRLAKFAKQEQQMLDYFARNSRERTDGSFFDRAFWQGYDAAKRDAKKASKS